MAPDGQEKKYVAYFIGSRKIWHALFFFLRFHCRRRGKQVRHSSAEGAFTWVGGEGLLSPTTEEFLPFTQSGATSVLLLGSLPGSQSRAPLISFEVDDAPLPSTQHSDFRHETSLHTQGAFTLFVNPSIRPSGDTATRSYSDRTQTNS